MGSVGAPHFASLRKRGEGVCRQKTCQVAEHEWAEGAGGKGLEGRGWPLGSACADDPACFDTLLRGGCNYFQ